MDNTQTKTNVDKNHPLFQHNNAFREVSGDRPIPPQLVKVGVEATRQAFFRGGLVGSIVFLSFLLGMLYLGTNPVYIATTLTIALTLIGAGIANYFRQWMAFSYFITLCPFLSIVVMSVGYRDVGGFFVTALSIFVYLSYIYLPAILHYTNLMVAALFIIFQYAGGAELLLGPASYSQSPTERLVLTILWLLAFAGTIQSTDRRNQKDLKKVVDLNLELDRIQASLVKANRALDLSNTELEARVQARTVALETALAHTRAANEAKDRFLATMSHELRTPLNAIIGYSELIPEIAEDSFNLEDEKEISQVSSNISQAGRSLLALINDVLDISSIESGKISPKLDEIALTPFIEMLQMLMSPQIKHNDNLLIIDNQANSDMFVTDRRLLQQILINLMSNAAKFTKNGTITLYISTSKRDHIRFEIQDTGIRIPKDKLTFIFEPFAQVDDSYQRRFEGTGLGLAITKQLTEVLGGTLGVESTHGVGSRFWVDLPLSSHPPAQ